MSAPGGSTPIVYHDGADMQNGGYGGDGSDQIVPEVVQPEKVEEVGTLVPQAALETIPVQPTLPGQPFPLFDGPRIFMHAPQCCAQWRRVVLQSPWSAVNCRFGGSAYSAARLSLDGGPLSTERI